jgi:CheY-like chemotaxis protein
MCAALYQSPRPAVDGRGKTRRRPPCAFDLSRTARAGIPARTAQRSIDPPSTLTNDTDLPRPTVLLVGLDAEFPLRQPAPASGPGAAVPFDVVGVDDGLDALSHVDGDAPPAVVLIDEAVADIAAVDLAAMIGRRDPAIPVCVVVDGAAQVSDIGGATTLRRDLPRETMIARVAGLAEHGTERRTVRASATITREKVRKTPQGKAARRAFDAEFEMLQGAYARRLPLEIARLGLALVRAAHDDAADLDELGRDVHTLAGTAGSYGFDAVGLLARQLHDLLLDGGEALPERGSVDLGAISPALAEMTGFADRLLREQEREVVEQAAARQQEMQAGASPVRLLAVTEHPARLLPEPVRDALRSEAVLVDVRPPQASAADVGGDVGRLEADVVIVEVGTPESPPERGLAICRALAEQRQGGSPRILAALEYSALRDDALAAGADDYLLRPAIAVEIRRRLSGPASQH